MDHPNIAKVHDGGTTDTGRPYFVMELVRGVRITDYCHESQLDTHQRLDLFIRVCQAVQHAHQKGIIHRDLKPSNILVTVNDGVPVPKVIDFGIAKATEGRLTDATVYTQLQQFIGTPAYMSPEQAVMTSLDIDTRSDIYSLGVLLYELLTGTTPFDTKELLKAGFDEMRRVIRETEPERPSTRLTQARAVRPAGPVESEIRNPKSEIEDDLDWIVMKCLEKDRNRRYETANGLAADLKRHLNNEPVVARPPSAAYRFRKMVRRNRLLFGAGTVTGVSLVIALGVSLSLLVRERRAVQRALAAEQTARLEATQREKVARFLGEIATGAMPESAEGVDGELLRSILDQAMHRVQASGGGQPSELWNLGLAYQGLGELDKAENLLREALRTARQTWGSKSDSLRDYRDELLDLLLRQGKPEQAEEIIEEALKADEGTSELTALLASRGSIRARQAKWKDAAADFQKALEQEPDNHELHHSLAPLLMQSGDVQEYLKHRQAVLVRFATTTDPIVAERMAKDCLLLPLPADAHAVVDDWTQTAIQAGPQHPAWKWLQLAKALVELRRDQFASAAEWAQQVASNAGEDSALNVQSFAVLAMAQYRLGQKANAAGTLARANEVCSTQLPKPGTLDLGASWGDWIIAHTLLREARQLVEPTRLSGEEAK